MKEVMATTLQQVHSYWFSSHHRQHVYQLQLDIALAEEKS